ncbi:HAMP domain-containing sensor histidine kinase [Microbispora sp. H10830]|uniref:sensor histidine kinase n=1 Tax=Microbispora sp. H10830 TaxID=2729109 RepID=UPI001602315B
MNSISNRIEHAERIAERALSQQRRFAADASHELLTPIAAIRAQLEAARLYPDDVSEAIDGALRATGRLEAIVSDLLLLTSITTITPSEREEIDLGRLVAAELAHRRAHRPLEVHLAPDVIVRGLRPLLARVVRNLLDNAERHAATAVRVDVRRDGERAVLAVGNDGETIPEADRERIFDRFFRRDTARSRSAGGSGLGLAIAGEAVKAHGGDISVQDAQPGTRFVVRLPLTRPAETTPEERRGQVVRLRGTSPRPGPPSAEGAALRLPVFHAGETAAAGADPERRGVRALAEGGGEAGDRVLLSVDGEVAWLCRDPGRPDHRPDHWPDHWPDRRPDHRPSVRSPTRRSGRGS